MLENFKQNGYHIEKNIFPSDYQNYIFLAFYDIAHSLIKRNNVKLDYELISTENVKYPNNIKDLDKLILSILNFDYKLVGEMYDTISYCSTFFKILSEPKILEITKKILNLKPYNTIYSWTHRVRIDPPKDNRRTYGWHQEIFYTIPKNRFIQTWLPVIRDATEENGTIEICPKSHLNGIVRQSWKEQKNKATQIIVDPKIVNNYNQLKLSMKKGDVLFFDPHLFHRSGNNITVNDIRYSLVGMWNDTTHKDFIVAKPEFKSRTISSKKYFEEKIK
jgi:hypothetical protein